MKDKQIQIRTTIFYLIYKFSYQTRRDILWKRHTKSQKTAARRLKSINLIVAMWRSSSSRRRRVIEWHRQSFSIYKRRLFYSRFIPIIHHPANRLKWNGCDSPRRETRSTHHTQRRRTQCTQYNILMGPCLSHSWPLTISAYLYDRFD